MKKGKSAGVDEISAEGEDLNTALTTICNKMWQSEKEGSEKHKEVNNNIKRCIKKGKRKLDRRTV